MTEELPEIIFVLENKMGGVAYMNKNVINNNTLRHAAKVKVILLNQTDSEHPRFTETFLADEVLDFRYASYENKYSVLKRLHALFGKGPGAIICNDGLEMEALHLFENPKTVYQIIHDFYNLKLAVKLGDITDVYVAHTKLFRDVLLSSDPAGVHSFFMPHGVSIPAVYPAKEELKGDLNIVFAGRLVDAKGVQDLFPIHKLLQQQGININWTIIGRGTLREMLQDQWKFESRIKFVSPNSNEEVMEIMSRNDLFVLPTRFEGSPVTVLEALATGLVPIVSALPGGIQEIVNNEIGRRVPVGNNNLFAEAIAEFHKDRILLQSLKINARKLASEQFDIMVTSDNYFKLFLQFADLKRKRRITGSLKIGFRLDQKWLPNIVVRFLRNKSFKAI